MKISFYLFSSFISVFVMTKSPSTIATSPVNSNLPLFKRRDDLVPTSVFFFKKE